MNLTELRDEYIEHHEAGMAVTQQESLVQKSSEFLGFTALDSLSSFRG